MPLTSGKYIVPSGSPSNTQTMVSDTYGTTDIADIIARLDTAENNLGILTLTSQVNGGWTLLEMEEGRADEFEDETGIDTGTSTAVYDSSSDRYGLTTSGLVEDPDNDFGAITSTFATSNSIFSEIGTGGTVTQIRIKTNAVADYIIKKGVLVSGNDYTITDIATVSVPSTNEEDITIPSTSFSAGDLIGYHQDGATNNYKYGADDVSIDHFYVSGNVTGSNTLTSATNSYPISILLPDTPTAEMLLQSNAYTASTAPSKARLVMLHEAVDSVTMNTDFTGKVSRDGTAFSSAVTFTEIADFNSSVKIYTTDDIDISGITSGTSVKYKLESFNSKIQYVHGVWIQWRA